MVNPYKWLWSKIGGRPWTYISRDIYHKFEYVVLMSLIIAGRYSNCISEREFWLVLGGITLGYIWGHFFWGKKYIPNQRGD